MKKLLLFFSVAAISVAAILYFISSDNGLRPSRGKVKAEKIEYLGQIHDLDMSDFKEDGTINLAGLAKSGDTACSDGAGCINVVLGKYFEINQYGTYNGKNASVIEDQFPCDFRFVMDSKGAGDIASGNFWYEGIPYVYRKRGSMDFSNECNSP